MFFIAFLVWMLTSKRVGWKNKTKLGAFLAAKPARAKLVSIIMLLLAFTLSIFQLGVGSGLFASVVILMAMGSLIVLFFPFRYTSMSWVLSVYVACLLIELFIK